MSRIVPSLLLLLAAGIATAEARPSTTNRSCAANRQSVAASGAIVLGTGGHTYDRFVRNRSFCQFDEFAEPAFVPSRDRASCFIGYRCTTNEPFWFD